MRSGSGVVAVRVSFVTARKVVFSPWTDCDSEGEGCGERN